MFFFFLVSVSLWSLWLLVYRPWGLGLVSYYVYVYMYIYIYICIYDNSVCICRHISMFFFFGGGGSLRLCGLCGY